MTWDNYRITQTTDEWARARNSLFDGVFIHAVNSKRDNEFNDNNLDDFEESKRDDDLDYKKQDDNFFDDSNKQQKRYYIDSIPVEKSIEFNCHYNKIKRYYLNEGAWQEYDLTPKWKITGKNGQLTDRYVEWLLDVAVTKQQNKRPEKLAKEYYRPKISEK